VRGAEKQNKKERGVFLFFFLFFKNNNKNVEIDPGETNVVRPEIIIFDERGGVLRGRVERRRE